MKKYKTSINESELRGSKLFDMIDDCMRDLEDTYVARMYSDDSDITIAVPTLLRKKYSADIDNVMNELGYKFYTSGINDEHTMLSYKLESANEEEKPANVYKVGMCVHINHLEGEDDRYDGKEGAIRAIDSLGQLHGTWGGLAIIPEEDDFEIIECDVNESKKSHRGKTTFTKKINESYDNWEDEMLKEISDDYDVPFVARYQLGSPSWDMVVDDLIEHKANSEQPQALCFDNFLLYVDEDGNGVMVCDDEGNSNAITVDELREIGVEYEALGYVPEDDFYERLFKIEECLARHKSGKKLNEDENDAKRADAMLDVHLDNANDSMQYVIAYINTAIKKGVERNSMDEVKENLTNAWKHCKAALDEISDAIDDRKLHHRK